MGKRILTVLVCVSVLLLSTGPVWAYNDLIPPDEIYRRAVGGG